MKKKLVIQKHHIQYARPEHKQEEIVASVFKGEHNFLTKLQWRNNHSKGFCKALKLWLILNEDKAQDLDKDEKE